MRPYAEGKLGPASFALSEPGCGSDASVRSPPGRGPRATASSSTGRRCGSPADRTPASTSSSRGPTGRGGRASAPSWWSAGRRGSPSASTRRRWASAPPARPRCASRAAASPRRTSWAGGAAATRSRSPRSARAGWASPPSASGSPRRRCARGWPTRASVGVRPGDHRVPEHAVRPRRQPGPDLDAAWLLTLQCRDAAGRRGAGGGGDQQAMGLRLRGAGPRHGPCSSSTAASATRRTSPSNAPRPRGSPASRGDQRGAADGDGAGDAAGGRLRMTPEPEVMRIRARSVPWSEPSLPPPRHPTAGSILLRREAFVLRLCRALEIEDDPTTHLGPDTDPLDRLDVLARADHAASLL